ncbi:MAG: XTP/dITP diphosphatase [Thermodesulfovibrionales bacterium]|nr:XTP/dITP diphosphatase [Thermodesulfovibrionales bacterium]
MFKKGIVLATKNQKKAEELVRILHGLNISVETLNNYPDCPDVVEDGHTFEANAVKKALFVSHYTGKNAIADDSGLEVYALGNMPGVYSARFAGVNATDLMNNEKLLNSMKDLKDTERVARFVCVIALVTEEGLIKTFKGVVEGMIAEDIRGSSGFGYDPLFIPEGFNETFGELPSQIKDGISHRGRALRLLQEYIRVKCNITQ